MADWSNLPSDVLFLIMKKLNKMDVIRCGSVSKSWFSVQQEQELRVLKLPWLLLGEDDPKTGSRGIFSLNEQKTDRLVLPELLGKRCCGSSHGWIFTIDIEMKVSLLHPLTGSQIQLPCLPPYSERSPNSSWNSELEELQEQYIKKGILSCDPMKSQSGCVAMVIYGEMCKLAYCTIGDRNWTVLRIDRTFYRDVILHNKRFYAVTYEGYTVACEIRPRTKLIRTFPVAPPCHLTSPGYDLHEQYLVDFKGELLHIERLIILDDTIREMGFDNEVMVERCKFLTERPHHPDPVEDELRDYRCFTSIFNVFMLDKVERTWKRVESLGDHAIFLGNNHTTCVAAAGGGGRCRANCIYFTDSYFDRYALYGYEDNGVYDMKNKTVRSVFSTEFFHPTMSPPTWYLI